MSRDKMNAGMSVSGIVQDPETQSRVIPESRRADGSIRKEKRVKPGFTPAEDVGKFVPSRIKEAQQRQVKNTIPGYEPVHIEAARKAMSRTSISSVPSNPSRADGDWRRGSPATEVKKAESSMSPSSSSKSRVPRLSNGASESVNWRNKESVVEKVPDDWEEEEEKKGEIVAEIRALKRDSKVDAPSIQDEKTSLCSISEASLEKEDVKKARALKKKVRAAQGLQERHQHNGESLLPEQQAKVDSLDDMIRDLTALGVKEEE